MNDRASMRIIEVEDMALAPFRNAAMSASLLSDRPITVDVGRPANGLSAAAHDSTAASRPPRAHAEKFMSEHLASCKTCGGISSNCVLEMNCARTSLTRPTPVCSVMAVLLLIFAVRAAEPGMEAVMMRSLAALL